MPRIGIYTEIILWCSHSHVAELWMSLCIHSTRCPNKFGMYCIWSHSHSLWNVLYCPSIKNKVQFSQVLFVLINFSVLFVAFEAITWNFDRHKKLHFSIKFSRSDKTFLVFFTISNCLESYRMFQRQHFPPKKVFKKYSKTAFPCSF